MRAMRMPPPPWKEVVVIKKRGDEFIIDACIGFEDIEKLVDAMRKSSLFREVCAKVLSGEQGNDK